MTDVEFARETVAREMFFGELGTWTMHGRGKGSGWARDLCTTLILVVLATVFPATVFPHAAFADQADAAAALETLTLVTGAKSAHPVEHVLMVEVMRTPEGREHGLMDRRFLPADRGMLFQFDTVQPVMMWMKNTYIPLDMIFLSRGGVVTHIAADAEPLSEAIIMSHGPAFAVLEVNAGFARKTGLKDGDLVRHAMFAR